MSNKQKDLIREVFMRNGFTIKAGADDLADYVYAAAHELLQVAPAVQTEPVAYLRKDQLRQAQRMGAMFGEIAASPRVDRVPVYAAPQPATEAALLEAFVAQTAAQAEAADLAGALDGMIEAADVASWGGHFPTAAVTRAVEALAVCRKQGGGE